MVNEESFRKNKITEAPKQKEYSDEEIKQKLSEKIDLDNDFALYLWENGKLQTFVDNIKSFSGLDKEFAIKLIWNDYGDKVVDNPGKFIGLDLDKEIALKFIEADKGWHLAENIDKFIGSDHREIALKLIGTGNDVAVACNLDKFIGLDKEVALKLIRPGLCKEVAANLDKFIGLDYREIALKFIKANGGSYLVKNIDKFIGLDLDKEIALKFIEANDSWCLAYNLNKFIGLDRREIVLKMIEASRGRESRVEEVTDFLGNRFVGLDHREIALKLFEVGKGDEVAYNLDKFIGLDKEVALKLFEVGEGYRLAKNIDKFIGSDHREIALKLIDAGDGNLVIYYLDKFIGLDKEVALKLIKADQGKEVANHLDKFIGLDQKVALKLFEAGNGGKVADNLDKFVGLDYREIFFTLIRAGQKNEVIKNIDKFNLAPLDLYQVIKDCYPEFMAEIETMIPKLAAQMAKSSELLLDVLAIQSKLGKLKECINDNPFLLEALTDNPRYGSRLIIKFRKFDKEAKSNIRELFGNEADILRENPDIDKDSIEFRRLMQEKLISFSNNQEIVDELKDRGVDSEQWLNYSEETYFTLGDEENVRFSDQIKTPITRIKETLGKYESSIVNALSYYKVELQASFVPNQETKTVKQKIGELKQRIEGETDSKRAEGMRRGLASLEAKAATIKPVGVWDKIQSDIFRLKSMIENIFRSHDTCLQVEARLEATKTRKELIKEKESLEKSKSQLRDSFKEFESFFESYEDKLRESIAPSLGQERVDSLLQEIRETLGEEFSHYDVDKNTLKGIFYRSDEDERGLNGREMRISIASRRTRDLYLGNYCPCCICIDSEYHGAESPIADYVTDLGMQNIVVYDEKTDSPVVVCWAFIGEKNKGGDPVLVIDNIEANTEYTNNYPDKLKKVIAKYVNDYARAVNVKTVIQGPDNNDLEVFPTGRVLCKLGNKYNRFDGYFLEAENDNDVQEDWDDDEQG